MVGVLGLHAVASGSNLILSSGLDLFPVVPDSTPPRFVIRQLIASCQLGFLNMFLSSLSCFFQIIKKWGACKLCSLIAKCTSTINKAFTFFVFFITS